MGIHMCGSNMSVFMHKCVRNVCFIRLLDVFTLVYLRIIIDVFSELFVYVLAFLCVYAYVQVHVLYYVLTFFFFFIFLYFVIIIFSDVKQKCIHFMHVCIRVDHCVCCIMCNIPQKSIRSWCWMFTSVEKFVIVMELVEKSRN